MANVHILGKVRGGYSGLVHFNVPAGNNSAGVSWKDAGLAAGLLGGESPIAAEAAAIAAGDVVEVATTFKADANPTALVALAAQVKIDWVKTAKAKLKYYGYSTGAVS